MPFTASSTWTWIDHPVSGLRMLTSRPVKTWFPFGSVPVVLNPVSYTHLENNEESVYLTEQQTSLLKASTKLNFEQYNALLNFLEKL